MTLSRNDPQLELLATSLDGYIIRPSDSKYHEARRVWNGMIDEHPALIAMCGSRGDVVQAIKFARGRHLEVAVRGGGHNVSGRSVCSDGMVVDLSLMKGITVNAPAKTASAEPGLTWGEFDATTAKFGLATTGGLVSSTGVSGLTLGGGVGWLMRKHGLACDNLISAEMVTADGEIVTASSESNHSLLWALQGGGGNFGVVTRLDYGLHQVGMVTGGLLVYPLVDAPVVARFYRESLLEAPEALTTFLNFITLPDGTRAVALAVCCLLPKEESEILIRPMRSLGKCLVDSVHERPYPELQTTFDAGCPAGRHNYWRSGYLTELSDTVIDVMIDYFSRVSSPYTTIDVEPYGGAVGARSSTDTAFPHRDNLVNLLICSMWLPQEDPLPHMEWTREYWSAMQPFIDTRVYVNYLDGTSGQTARAAFGPNLERLTRVKSRYDPDNFFHLNHNISPSSQHARSSS